MLLKKALILGIYRELIIKGWCLKKRDKVSINDTFEIKVIKTTENNGLVKSNTSYMEPAQIVEHAIQQINTLSFMQLDEEIDREIDKYFANKHAKK